MDELKGRVALVAGGTRGASRAIAVELGRRGAHVYVTGRTTRASRSEVDRPETIEDTVDLVRAAGGSGESVPVDHLDPAPCSRWPRASTGNTAGSTSSSTGSGAAIP
jgi:NAD(P)-dependent dehydrogenase (short-subunit alcohol dehydrogenase family)